MARAPKTSRKRAASRYVRVLKEDHDAATAEAATANARVAELEVACFTLQRHVELCRRSFFRLAECRAADTVIHQGKSWDEGAAYINAEMTALDQKLVLTEERQEP